MESKITNQILKFKNKFEQKWKLTILKSQLNNILTVIENEICNEIELLVHFTMENDSKIENKVKIELKLKLMLGSRLRMKLSLMLTFKLELKLKL